GDEGDLWEGGGVEWGVGQHRDVLGAAGLDLVLGKLAKRRDHLGEPPLADGDRALGGRLDVLLAVTIDQLVEPEVEDQYRRADEQYAGDDRDECLLARPAQIRPRIDNEQAWRAGVNAPLSLH